MTDTPEVRTLCERLVPGVIPKLVDVDPPPRAKINDCFVNVPQVVEEFGGTMELGWQLWERLPGLLIEAEAHAVWKSDKTERRVDVTPKETRGINRIVFLPDLSLVYDERQINSVRAAVVDDPLITELIAALDEQFEILNRDELADFHGELVATPELLANAERQVGLLEQIRDKYFADERAGVDINP